MTQSARELLSDSSGMAVTWSPISTTFGSHERSAAAVLIAFIMPQCLFTTGVLVSMAMMSGFSFLILASHLSKTSPSAMASSHSTSKPSFLRSVAALAGTIGYMYVGFLNHWN